MKTTPTHSAWNRLAAAARLAPPPEGSPAPFGFATRVAARGLERTSPTLGSLCEFFSWRALGLAGLIAIASIAANLGPVLKAVDESPVTVGDPVAEVLSLT